MAERFKGSPEQGRGSSIVTNETQQFAKERQSKESFSSEHERALSAALNDFIFNRNGDHDFAKLLDEYTLAVEAAGLAVLPPSEAVPDELEREIESAWHSCTANPEILLDPRGEEFFIFLQKHFSHRPLATESLESAFRQAAEKIVSDFAHQKISTDIFKKLFSTSISRYGRWAGSGEDKARALFVRQLLWNQAIDSPKLLQKIQESIGEFSFSPADIEDWSNDQVWEFVRNRHYSPNIELDKFSRMFKEKCARKAARFGIEPVFSPSVYRTHEGELVEVLDFVRLEASTGIVAKVSREEAERLLVSGLTIEYREEELFREMNEKELGVIRKYLGADQRLSPESYEEFWEKLLANNEYSSYFIIRRVKEALRDQGPLSESITHLVQKHLSKDVAYLKSSIRQASHLDERSVYLIDSFKDLAKLSLATGVALSDDERESLFVLFFSRGSEVEHAREFSELTASLLVFTPSAELRRRAAEERIAILLQNSRDISPAEYELFATAVGEEIDLPARARIGEAAIDKLFIEDFSSRDDEEHRMNDVVVNSIDESVEKIAAFTGVKARIPESIAQRYAHHFFKENLYWDKRSSPVELLDKTFRAFERISFSPSIEYLGRCAGQVLEKMYLSGEPLTSEGRQQVADFFNRLETLISPENLDMPSLAISVRDELVNNPLSIIRWNEFLRQDGHRVPFLSKFSEVWSGDAWVSMFENLAHVQKPSASAEHDPWRTEFSALMKRLQGGKTDSYGEELPAVIDIHNPEDSKIVRRFILDMGMINSPQWFAVYTACLRTKQLADLPQKMIDDLSELGLSLYKKTNTGNTPRFQNTASVLPEIAKLKFRFQSELLAGRLPPGARHKLGGEMFNALRGTSIFGSGSNADFIISEWEQTTKHHPETLELPPGYKEFTLDIPEAPRPSPQLEAAVLKELQEPRWKALRRHAEIIRKDDGEWWVDFKLRLNDYAKRLEQMPNVSDRDLEALRSSCALVEQQSRGSGYLRSSDLFDTLLVLSKTAPSEESDDLVQELSLMCAFRKFSGNADERAQYLTQFGGFDYKDRGRLDSIKQYFAMARFEEEYLREQYLHEDQKRANVGHPPFDQETLRRLSTIWSDPKRRISSAARHAEERFRTETARVSGSVKKQSIAIVPTRGPLRPLAGAIADACFINADIPLARGEFPHLTTWMYVAGRSTSRERIVGSVLTIDTHRSDGVPALLVRGNNPRENLARSVNADSLVVQSLRGLVDVARAQWQERQKSAPIPSKRRQCVMIPRDVTKGSSTNRFSIGDVYERRFTSWVPRERSPYVSGLDKQPENEFNHHKNWDEHGLAASVVIWEIDEQGVEQWYGDWS